MELSERNIITQKTARYYVSGTPSSTIKNIWVVIHGYGQLAENFIQQFDFLVNEDTLVIAPEGLSKFYTGNRIGASWMTKEDRENEIKDYLSYLDLILKDVSKEIDYLNVKVNVLGFSQGVHTAVRWFTLSGNKFDSLYLCSDDFPKDTDFEKLKTKLNGSKMFFIFGDADGIIPQTTFDNSVQMMKEQGLNFETIIFEGKHIINTDTIKKLAGM